METPSTTVQMLAAEGIADYPQDLRQLSAAELRELGRRLRERLAAEA